MGSTMLGSKFAKLAWGAELKLERMINPKPPQARTVGHVVAASRWLLNNAKAKKDASSTDNDGGGGGADAFVFNATTPKATEEIGDHGSETFNIVQLMLEGNEIPDAAFEDHLLKPWLRRCRAIALQNLHLKSCRLKASS